jgi:hypothetical protein
MAYLKRFAFLMPALKPTRRSPRAPEGLLLLAGLLLHHHLLGVADAELVAKDVPALYAFLQAVRGPSNPHPTPQKKVRHNMIYYRF